ncbi:hypothetical protein D3C80_1372070 [compost metagenome]
MSGSSVGLTRLIRVRDARVAMTVRAAKIPASTGRPRFGAIAAIRATTPAATAGHSSHSVEAAASMASRTTPTASHSQKGWLA